MPRRTSFVAAATGASLLLVVPASASALTATINQPCYTHVPLGGSQPLVVAVAGGTPGANFQVAATVPGKGVGSAGSATGTFDATGRGTAQITDVFPPSGTIGPTKGQVVQLSARDFGAGGGDVPVGQALITTLAMSVATKPRSIRAHRQIAVSGTAFARQRLYGFVTAVAGTHVLRRIALGMANVCGYASARGIVAPRSARTGIYRLYVNAGPTLNRKAAIYTSFRLYRTGL